MASPKKDRSLVYWNMNYQGKLRRTKQLIPICVVLAIAAPFWTQWDSGSMLPGLAFSVLLVVVAVAQYAYNKKKADEEEADQAAHGPQDGPFQG